MDVIVVGAGPVGLLLAAELKLGGADVVVLERLAVASQVPKASGYRTLGAEALERRGLGPVLDAEEASSRALLKSRITASRNLGVKQPGGHFAGMALIDQAKQREPERRMRGVRQEPLERILGDYVASLGIEVRREHVVTSFEESADAVIVHLQDREALRTKWLVACDGGRSTIRKLAGFEFEGTDPTATFYQALCTLDHPERLGTPGWRRTPTGMMSTGPEPGRIATMEFDGPPDRDAPLTKVELEAAIRRVSGADVRVLDVQTLTRFTDHERQATTYRKGRVLLAGDAAHVHSPAGGQGLNLGLVDAANLGWKLAAVIRGDAPDALLDTYTAERHAAAAVALANSRAQIALMRPDPQTSALRDVVAAIMRTDEGNRFFGELMSGTTVRYDLGSDDPRVGTLLGDRSLFEPMHDGAALLVDAGLEPVELSPRVRRVTGPGPESMLVRPDGCIAWIGTDVDGLRAALARWSLAAR